MDQQGRRQEENQPLVERREPKKMSIPKKFGIGFAVFVAILAILAAFIMAVINRSSINQTNASLQQSRHITYIHWGHLECPPTPGTTKLYEGFAAGTYATNETPTPSSLCLPTNYRYVNYKKDSQYGNTKVYMVHELQYNTFIPGQNGKQVACAVCKTTSRSTILMMPATDRCYNTTPTDNSWTKEYDGYLMQASGAGSDYYCVDYDMHWHYESQRLYESQHNAEISVLSHVVAGEDLPRVNGYDPQKVLSCAVCTI